MMETDHLVFSGDEVRRLERIDRLVAEHSGGVAPLLDLLDDPSWSVRRAVVGGLAGAGQSAVAPLCQALASRRDSEARIAATVDALVASTGDPDQQLADLARQASAPVAADVAQILGRRRSIAGLPTLVQLILHPDDNVAVSAIEALGRIGGRVAVDALVESIGSGNFFRTFPAIDVLGRSGDPRAVLPLTELLEEPHYAGEAARALGRSGDRAAVAPLMRLLGRGVGATVRVAALALCDLRQRSAEHFGSGDRIEEAIRQAGDPAVVRHVVRALSEGDPGEQIALCFVIGTLADASAAPALLALLNGPPEVAAAASAALRRLGPDAEAQILKEIRDGGTRRVLLPLISQPAATALVVDCLRDADPDVRAQACETLGRMGATTATADLFPLLADANSRVAFAAMGTIQALGGRETQDLALAAARAPTARVRRSALRILAYFAFPLALDTLFDALLDSDERVREAAIQGLPFFDDPRALEALLAATKTSAPRTRAAAFRALGQCVGDLRVSAYLIKGLGDPDPWVRYYACQSLGKLAFEPAAQAIGELLVDPAGQVRVAAVEALSFLSSDAALTALESAARDGEPDVRRAALVGLGVAHRAESLPVILQAVAASEPATRVVALSALSGFRAPEALKALLECAADRDDAIRTVAIGLLSTRPGQATTVALAQLLRSSPVGDQIVAALSLHIEGRVPGLAAALEEADDEQASGLASALARLGRPDATAALIGAMTSSNSRARKAAATTLAGLGHPEALGALRAAAANDRDPEVRKVCALLLTR
ncbi:MAG TPA: HEAT repeat domain-containing protein [Polyangia bacterium]|nr:HEAT repeat domain-containing protein [Polyangia bacterium]